MSIAELGSIGEFVASIAVLVTLLFLIFQMRQNTRTMRITISTTVIQNWVEIGNEPTRNDDFADIYSRVMFEGVSLESLSNKDRAKLDAWVLSGIRTLELSYLHWLDGHLDARIWEGHLNTFRVFMSMPAIEASWVNGIRALCSQQFRDFTDDIIDQGPIQGTGSAS